MTCGLLLLDCEDEDVREDFEGCVEGGLEEVVDFEGVEGVEVVGRLGGIEVVVLWRMGEGGLQGMGGCDCEVAIVRLRLICFVD